MNNNNNNNNNNEEFEVESLYNLEFEEVILDPIVKKKKSSKKAKVESKEEVKVKKSNKVKREDSDKNVKLRLIQLRIQLLLIVLRNHTQDFIISVKINVNSLKKITLKMKNYQRLKFQHVGSWLLILQNLINW